MHCEIHVPSISPVYVATERMEADTPNATPNKNESVKPHKSNIISGVSASTLSSTSHKKATSEPHSVKSNKNGNHGELIHVHVCLYADSILCLNQQLILLFFSFICVRYCITAHL